MSPPETDLSIAEIVMPKGNLKDSDATKQIKNTPLLGRVFYLGHEETEKNLFFICRDANEAEDEVYFVALATARQAKR